MKKLRIGILGSGSKAGNLAQKITENPEAAIVAACDINAEITAAFIEKNFADTDEKPASFTDAAAMYAEANLDGVMIVTPHTLHYQHGMQALEAGLHVFMEKPLVTSTEDARTLAAKVNETDRVFAVGFNTPCTAVFKYLREQIRANTWGKLELVNGYLSQNWLTLTVGTWRQKPELSGGGQAYDSGAHILNSLTWSVESSVAKVFSFIDNHETPVDINSVIVVKFKNKVMASLAISGNCLATASSHMVFIFEKARIEVDGWNGGFIKVFTKDGEESPELSAQSNLPTDNFINAILGREDVQAGPQNGIHHSELMDAIYESARTGSVAQPITEGSLA